MNNERDIEWPGSAQFTWRGKDRTGQQLYQQIAAMTLAYFELLLYERYRLDWIACIM